MAVLHYLMLPVATLLLSFARASNGNQGWNLLEALGPEFEEAAMGEHVSKLNSSKPSPPPLLSLSLHDDWLRHFALRGSWYLILSSLVPTA